MGLPRPDDVIPIPSIWFVTLASFRANKMETEVSSSLHTQSSTGDSPKSRDRICVIFNPKARGEKATKLKTFLHKITGACDQKPTTCAGDGRRLATEAVKEGYETIVAAGGDGTLNEVLNGIADAPNGFDKVKLGILPLGTINVFARELKIGTNIESAWKTIITGTTIAIDIPVVEFTREGKREKRHFAQLAGAGLDSRAVHMVSWELKKKVGPFAYVVAGLKALTSAQSSMTVTIPGKTFTGELVLIGNGRLYGGDFVLFPGANLQDGALEICIFPKINWQILARAGIGLATNRFHQLCNVQQIQAASLTVSASTQTFLQLDGENVGELPATFSLDAKRLRVIAPGGPRGRFPLFD